MTRVVISQPMFFPWVGFLEQMRLADIFVHYDDVQYSKGSFTNRVQVRTTSEVKWLTVPLKHYRLGQPIREVEINHQADWRSQHRALLKQSYARAPYVNEMLTVLDSVYTHDYDTIGDLAIHSMKALAGFFALDGHLHYCRSSDLGIAGKGSPRVLEIVRALGGKTYVTGHGARNYLAHEAFEQQGVQVEYLDYQKIPYRQVHGEFTPYVSALDLIANEGLNGARFITSPTIHWKEFTGRE